MTDESPSPALFDALGPELELKVNFLRAAREGVLQCEARPVHLGRTTQVWDATVTSDGRDIALFRCTQLVLQDRDGG